MTEIAARPPEPTPLLSAIGAMALAVKRLVAAHARWRLRRKTARTLSGLSDDMLKDLGLTRADLRAHEGKDDMRNWRTIDRSR